MRLHVNMTADRKSGYQKAKPRHTYYFESINYSVGAFIVLTAIFAAYLLHMTD